MDMTRKCSRDRRSLVVAFVSTGLEITPKRLSTRIRTTTMGNLPAASTRLFRCCFLRKELDNDDLSTVTEQSSAIDQLYETYREKHAWDDWLFEQEFQVILRFSLRTIRNVSSRRFHIVSNCRVPRRVSRRICRRTVSSTFCPSIRLAFVSR